MDDHSLAPSACGRSVNLRKVSKLVVLASCHVVSSQYDTVSYGAAWFHKIAQRGAQGVFTIELICRVIAYGFFFGWNLKASTTPTLSWVGVVL